jgi:hypothetical protein
MVMYEESVSEQRGMSIFSPSLSSDIPVLCVAKLFFEEKEAYLNAEVAL